MGKYRLQLVDQCGEAYMLCFICGTESVDYDTAYGGRDVGCPKCGRHIISGNLIAAMAGGYAPDVEDARAVLNRMRDRSEVPILSTADIQLHRLPN